MSRVPIRLRQPATGQGPLIVRTVRMDVAPGEPEALRAEQELIPGEEITAYVYPGSVLVIMEAPPNAR